MEVITSQKQGLSTAEKQFLKDLREKKQMLPAFKAKIDQVLHEEWPRSPAVGNWC
jgi:hypothetical protein